MNRRDLMRSAAVIAGTTTLGSMAAGVAKAEKNNQETKAKLRLACYWGGFIPAENDDARVKKMLDWGFEGVEVSGDGSGAKGDLKKRLDDANLEICSVCFGSCGGKIVSDDVSLRQKGIDELKTALENAGVLGAKCVVYVPAFNGQTKLGHKEVREILIDTLPDIAKFAAEHDTNVVLEPLCRGEAWFLRMVADGAGIASECERDHGGIGVLGDFYHMTTEESSDMGAFISGGKRLKHVHLGNGPQAPRRTLPGQDDRPFFDGFRGLKYIGYDRFCSFECGVHGDKEIEIPKSIAFLKDEWERAEI